MISGFVTIICLQDTKILKKQTKCCMNPSLLSRLCQLETQQKQEAIRNRSRIVQTPNNKKSLRHRMIIKIYISRITANCTIDSGTSSMGARLFAGQHFLVIWRVLQIPLSPVTLSPIFVSLPHALGMSMETLYFFVRFAFGI